MVGGYVDCRTVACSVIGHKHIRDVIGVSNMVKVEFPPLSTFLISTYFCKTCVS